MSSTVQGSNDVEKGKGPKGDKSRRVWSQKEEEVLIAALKELVAQGWKSDNEFRAGYLNRLEDAIKKEFPGTDLRVNPNIVSKLTVMKKNYYSLQNILSRSGVGFNLKGYYMIDCGDEQWEQIVKMDANVRLMRYKSWPLLDDWKEIFEKDRATGENADDIQDAINDLCNNDDLGKCRVVDDDIDVCIDDMFTSEASDAAEDSVGCGVKYDGNSKQRGRKHRVHDGMQGVCEVLSQMHRDTSAKLEKLTNRIGYEFDLGKARKELFEQLGNIPGLSLDDKFDVCDILEKQVEQLEIFTSIDCM